MLLDTPERLVYFLLKVEMADHEVLAKLDAIALLGGQQIAPPPRVMVDFVVCKRDFTPLAAIMLDRGESQPLRERVIQQLAQGGIRVLRWPVKALPKREAVRALVLAQSVSAPAETGPAQT